MTIDAHQHFWCYRPEDHDCRGDGASTLRRDFLPEDLKPQCEMLGIDGVITVQTRHSLAETQWLLALADTHPFIQGVIGWVPLCDERILSILDRLAFHPTLKGFRHLVRDETHLAMLENPAFNNGVNALAEFGFTYDLVIHAAQLPAAVAFADRHPDQIIVLDHLAKPLVEVTPSAEWRKWFGEIAKRDNVYCKFSGLATAVPRGHQWTPRLLEPYFDIAIETFGARRLMFGSDWPMCLVAARYDEWYEFAAGCASRLSDAERALVMGGTAARVYDV